MIRTKKTFILNLFQSKWLLCLCLLVFSLGTSYGQIAATLKADSSHIEIGDYLKLKLVINSDSNLHKILFPKFPLDTLGGLEIVERGKIDTATASGRYILSQTLIVAGYDSGLFTIPTLAITYFDKQKGIIDSTFTNDLQIQVSTLPVDTAKPFKPIKAPLKVAYTFKEIAWWVALALGVLLLLLGAYFIYKKYFKKKEKTVERPKPKEPAHIWALTELKKLEEQKLWQQDEVKKYHSKIADILRLYMEYRYDYYAMESTTEEIKDEISHLEIEPSAKDKLMETLRMADFVKFAKMNPAPDENIKSLELAKNFVQTTQLIVVPNQPTATVSKTNKKKRKG